MQPHHNRYSYQYLDDNAATDGDPEIYGRILKLDYLSVIV